METTGPAKGFISQYWQPSQPFFLSRPSAGLPLACQLGAFAFASQSEKLFPQGVIGNPWWMAGEQPLAKGPGETVQARKNEKGTPSQPVSAFSGRSASPTHPAQNLLPFRREDLSGTCPGAMWLRRVRLELFTCIFSKYFSLRRLSEYISFKIKTNN